jgi:hypothetical protein
MPAGLLSPHPVHPPPAPRLLDHVRQVALAHFGRPDVGERFAEWVRRFVVFHSMRHPRELDNAAVGRFMEHVGQTEKVPLRVMEQAHETLTFLYANVLQLRRDELPFPEPPRLLDRLRRAMRVGHYSRRTEDCYAEWAARFIRFHRMRHPNTMGSAEVEQFLPHLAVAGRVAASTLRTCSRSSGLTASGNMVRRSFPPLPWRTTMTLFPPSRSLMRR